MSRAPVTHQPRSRALKAPQHLERTIPRSPLYDSARWKATRKYHLQAEPICRMCWAEGRTNALDLEVDHVRPHKGLRALFFDPKNLQTLCKMHHSQKTVREDGGFGRKT